jgi:hypothetical protein
MNWMGAFGMHGERRNWCRVLVGKCAEKRWLGRPRNRKEDNTKMDLEE